MNVKRIYKKNKKSTSGWGYWGDYGEIEIGLSSGKEILMDDPQVDKLHYHQLGTTFFLITEGSGIIEVENEKITVSKDEVLRIAPGEKYRYVKAVQVPFSWITICTSKDKEDKIIAK